MDVARFTETASSSPTANALALVDSLFENSIVSAATVEPRLGVSAPTARATIQALAERGILREITGRQWGRVFRVPGAARRRAGVRRDPRGHDFRRTSGDNDDMSAPAQLQAEPTRRWSRYPEYRDSGVEWLGEIPAHWEVGRLKTIAHVQLSNVDKKSVEGEEPVTLCNYVDVYYNERITTGLEFMSATATSDQVRRLSLQRGDVLITKDSESWTDIAVPAVVDADLPAVLCGYHLALVRPRRCCDGAFLARAFSAIGPRSQFHVAANGITRFGLSQDVIRTSLFAVPPLEEQRAIAAFLDRQTAEINALIEKKARLIGLLEEKRAALISHAVTKGLDARAPIRDSGEETLGSIPVHWAAVRLKLLAAKPLMYGANEAAGSLEPYQPRFVRITDIDESGRLRAETFQSLPEEVAKPYLLRAGDLLFARSGATAGKTFLYDESWGRACFAGYLIRFRADPGRAMARWVWYFSGSGPYRAWLSRVLIQATIQNVSAERYANLVVPVPALEEQETIIHVLDRETAKIDALAAKIREHIERLREYRAALISAAVIGKIDVRDEVEAA